MNILQFIFLFTTSGIFYNIILFCLGKLLYLIGIHKIGHYMVASSIAGDFGLCKKTRKWIHKNCYQRNKEKCKLWTCENYENCKKIN